MIAFSEMQVFAAVYPWHGLNLCGPAFFIFSFFILLIEKSPFSTDVADQ
jgi:hypothetical protein